MSTIDADRVLTNEEYEDLNEPTIEPLNIAYSVQDFPVDALVKRLKRGSLFIPRVNNQNSDVPGFQRGFVWTRQQMDRFIESILLGYPIPSIFLVKQTSDNRMLVLDGQQRLETLRYYYEGTYKDRVFRLQNVSEEFKGLTYKDLREDLRYKIDDTSISATIVNSDQSERANEAVYNIFERLNSGGTQLTPHEIRVALYSGRLISQIEELNSGKDWRKLIGDRNKRLRDHEIVLRILAAYYEGESYSEPLKRFLNCFTEKHRNGVSNFEEVQKLFEKSIKTLISSKDQLAEDKSRSFLQEIRRAPVAEVVVAALMQSFEVNHEPIEYSKQIFALLKNDRFMEASQSSTTNKEKYRARLSIAQEHFGL